MAETTREVVLWDCCEDQETLIWSDRDDAIDYYLNQMSPKERTGTVTVYGFARMPIPENVLDEDMVIDWLEEGPLNEYVSPEDGLEPTDEMIAAAKEFCRAILASFKPWTCEVVTEQEINADTWIAEHRPEWLTGAPVPGKER